MESTDYTSSHPFISWHLHWFQIFTDTDRNNSPSCVDNSTNAVLHIDITGFFNRTCIYAYYEAPKFAESFHVMIYCCDRFSFIAFPLEILTYTYFLGFIFQFDFRGWIKNILEHIQTQIKAKGLMVEKGFYKNGTWGKVNFLVISRYHHLFRHHKDGDGRQ